MDVLLEKTANKSVYHIRFYFFTFWARCNLKRFQCIILKNIIDTVLYFFTAPRHSALQNGLTVDFDSLCCQIWCPIKVLHPIIREIRRVFCTKLLGRKDVLPLYVLKCSVMPWISSIIMFITRIRIRFPAEREDLIELLTVESLRTIL